MERTVENQRRGAWIRIIIDRPDKPATKAQMDGFDNLTRTLSALGNGYMNSPTLQQAWFRRQDLPLALRLLDEIEEGS